jgi:hypothetical protein
LQQAVIRTVDASAGISGQAGKMKFPKGSVDNYAPSPAPPSKSLNGIEISSLARSLDGAPRLLLYI